MKPLGSAPAVLAMMRDDAAAEVERIEKDAEAQARRLEGEDGAGTPADDREQRLAEAARQRRERLAREEAEERRAALDVRERWIACVVAEGRKLLECVEPRDERRAVLETLAREALERLPPGDHVISTSAVDADLARDLGVRVGPPAAIRGGCIVRCGNLSVDNSFDERERRFEPQWRAALARMYGP
jgi:vacuolar-type H+-ATPase subunit E/Vma4